MSKPGDPEKPSSTSGDEPASGVVRGNMEGGCSVSGGQDAGFGNRDTGSPTAWPVPVLRRGVLFALLLWGFLVLVVSGLLAEFTGIWWLVLVFGAAAPVALVVAQNRALGAGRPAPVADDDRSQTRERELLEALRERGEITPTAAAMRTSLTVKEASGMLEELAQKGHLEMRAQDGAIVYALRGRDLRELQGSESAPGLRDPRKTPPDFPGEPLAEPLSERELEVLKLLASGRTNVEISRALFVALGTVKAHVNNIYRKLGVRNRTEAVLKARSLGLVE